MTLTEILILATIAIWIVYDIYIYITKGNAATESATTWHFAYTLPSIPWSVGILMGHLFLQSHAPTPVGMTIPAFYGTFQLIFLLLSLAWLTFDFLQYYRVKTCCAFSQMLWDLTGHMTWIPLVGGAIIGAIFFQMHEPTATAMFLLEVSATCT